MRVWRRDAAAGSGVCFPGDDAVAGCGQDGVRRAGVAFTAIRPDDIHPQFADSVEHKLDKRAQHRGQQKLTRRWDSQSVCLRLRLCHGVNRVLLLNSRR